MHVELIHMMGELRCVTMLEFFRLVIFLYNETTLELCTKVNSNLQLIWYVVHTEKKHPACD